jgi:cytoskeletal protein RodZ
MDDFGGKLRHARERRGVSLRQIAASTKISPTALEALERNDISKLPGGIFSRAFVRSYALEVGLDPDETVREFLERFDQEPAQPASIVATDVPQEEREFQERQRKAARIAVGGVAVIVMVTIALVFLYRARAARARAQEEAARAAVTAAVSAPSPAQESAAPASAPVPPPEPPAPVAPAGRIQLEIQPTGDCWVSLTVDGKKVFARVMAGGERQSVTVATEATVDIGDAGVFAYTINGKPGRALGDKGQVRTLRLTPATASEFIR